VLDVFEGVNVSETDWFTQADWLTCGCMVIDKHPMPTPKCENPFVIPEAEIAFRLVGAGYVPPVVADDCQLLPAVLERLINLVLGKSLMVVKRSRYKNPEASTVVV
jgi:hypothetical protein